MTKAPDFTKVMQDMMASFPVDASAFQNAFKTQAAFGEKLTKVALDAAEKSTEISSKWAKDALAKLWVRSDWCDYLFNEIRHRFLYILLTFRIK